MQQTVMRLLRTVYNNIDDRIVAFKFAFTPLAHKVFKFKKRLRVENEEEWSRSKKSGLEVRRVNLVILNQLLIKW